MRTAPTLLLLSLLLVKPLLQAADEKGFAPVPPPPAMRGSEERSESDNPGSEEEEMAPQVTIIKRKDAIIEEYRRAGQLYMVKITPSKGYPYYLIDTDGDGSLETRRNELDNPPVVQWKILQW